MGTFQILTLPQLSRRSLIDPMGHPGRFANSATMLTEQAQQFADGNGVDITDETIETYA